MQSQALQYTNRKGDTYYLHAATRRGGGRAYVLKRSSEGGLPALPPGFEIVENVNGLASVRRARERIISDREEALVRAALVKRLARYRYEIKDATITIFEPDTDADELAELLGHNPFETLPLGHGAEVERRLRGQMGDSAVNDYLRQRREKLRARAEPMMHYGPVMRFRLADRGSRLDKTKSRLAKCKPGLAAGAPRLFEVARMTYRGKGGWWTLDHLPLVAAVKKYVRHLGRESFFELI